jgi:hypothetical protein
MFAVMDFLTVPTTIFGVLYRFFTIGHDQPDAWPAVQKVRHNNIVIRYNMFLT